MVKSGHQLEVVAPFDPAIIEDNPQLVPVHRFRYIWPRSLHLMGHGRSLVNDMQLHPLAYLLLPFYLLASFITLMRVTSVQRTDAIHAHWVIPNGLVAAWVANLRNIPLIISLHGSDIFIAKDKAFFGVVARWIFSRAMCVTACSPELHQVSLELGAPTNTKLIPWGVNPNIFRPDRKVSNRYSSLGITDSNIVITALGRLVKKKGFDVLIDAMPAIVNEAPQVHLLLCGNGVLNKQLHHQAEVIGMKNHITFMGNISWSDVPDFLANSDIFVLPSVRDKKGNIDGLPTVLLEAMSSGQAVVASNIGGVSLVIEDSKSGLLVNHQDPQALADAILKLIHNIDLRHMMAQNARHNVEMVFNWSKIAQCFTELFESAAQQHQNSIT